MQKKVNLEIVKSSWTNVKPPFQKPCPFLSAKSPTNVDFLEALLWAGKAGISIRMPLWKFASLWAIFRYVGAADYSTKELRLHTDAEGLETHSKAVLSDDWGVGISLEWLSRQLKYRQVAHCKFVIPDLVARKLATMPKPKKRGPSKCPDFLAIDALNKLHVIECKGNQQGPEQTTQQFINGRSQKEIVKFKYESLVGQRLLSGIAIAGSDLSWKSTLTIADPPPGPGTEMAPEPDKSHYVINAQTTADVLPSMNKVTLIQGLLLAGAFEDAHRSFPDETGSGAVGVRQGDLSPFESAGVKWLGTIYETRYPISIQLDPTTEISGYRLRFGASLELLDRLREGRLESLLSSQFLAIQSSARSEVDHGEANEATVRYASIQQGSGLIADLELLTSTK